MRVIKIFLLFVCCISLDVQSQTFLSDTLGINEDGSVIIAKSLALPGWILEWMWIRRIICFLSGIGICRKMRLP